MVGTYRYLIGHINGFKNKIQLFIAELKISELYHFSACKEIAEEHKDANFITFLPILIEIEKEFNNRFADFDTLKQDLLIFNNPKGCTIEEQKLEYRLELCDLQADPFLLSRNDCGLDFFKLLNEKKYSKLVDLGLKICSMFGSSYLHFTDNHFIDNHFTDTISLTPHFADSIFSPTSISSTNISPTIISPTRAVLTNLSALG